MTQKNYVTEPTVIAEKEVKHNGRFPAKTYKHGKFNHVMIPMRDGTKLHAHIFFPTKDGKPDLTKKHPVMLCRSSYCSSHPFNLGAWLDIHAHATYRGFVYMVVAVRGTEKSEGVLEPMANEGWGTDGRPDHNGFGVHKDGIDTVEWISKQPWCNGKICTEGMSYMGGTQMLLCSGWLAAIQLWKRRLYIIPQSMPHMPTGIMKTGSLPSLYRCHGHLTFAVTNWPLTAILQK